MLSSAPLKTFGTPTLLLTIACLFGKGMDAIQAERAVAEEISLSGEFGAPRVIVSAPPEPALAHLSWPKIVRASDGALVLAFIAGEFHGAHGGGCPAVSVSRDGGRSFTPPRILQQFSRGEAYTSAGNVALGLAEDGAVVLLAMAYNSDQANTIVGWRSTDSGHDWRPVDTSTLDQNQTGSVYGHVISVPEKGLAVVGHYRKGSRPHTQGLWLSWSEDAGRSWSAAERIVDRYLVEPAVVFSQGEFVGLIRTGLPSDVYEQIVSRDFGKSWEVAPKGFAPPRERPLMLPSPCLVVDPARPGRLYCLASERHDPRHPSGLLGRIVLWEADQPELKWRERGVVAQFPRALGERKDITYGWMAPLGENRWYVVFYCGRVRGASDLYGLEIEIPE